MSELIQVDKKEYPYITEYADILKGSLTGIVGREALVANISSNLRRELMNNVILLGPAGVGKTALMEGYAATYKNEGVMVLAVDLGVMSGDGDNKFAERLNKLAKEVMKLADAREAAHIKGDIIVFLDEMHLLTMHGHSGTGGGSSAGNAIKPLASRGMIKMIGATTDEEYARYIKSDQALTRRFETLNVPEPDDDTVITILQNLAKKALPEDVFSKIRLATYREIVTYADRYLPAFAQPAKSLGIMDAAIGYYRSEGVSIDHELIRRIMRLKANVDVDFRTNLVHTDALLRTRVKGQDVAIEKVVDALAIANAGLNDPTRPVANFMFVGSTGAGKALADNTPVPIYTKGDSIAYKCHGDLVPGDMVFGRDGFPVEVLDVYPQGEKDAYAVHVESYFCRSVKCCKEHLWQVQFEEDGVFDDWVVMSLEAIMAHLEEHPNANVYLPRSFGCHSEDVILREGDLSFYRMGEVAPLIDYYGSYSIPNPYMKGSLTQMEALYAGLFRSLGQHKTIDGVLTDVFLHRNLPFIETIILIGETLGYQYLDLAVVDTGDELLYRLSMSGVRQERVLVEGIERLHYQLPMTCIRVDSEDHLYQAGELPIVTHNTELAKAIAESMFGSEKAMIRADMSEYSQEKDVELFQKWLSEQVDKQPFSVILLDELDKTCRPILNLLLGVLDDGRLSDEYNRQTTFTNSIIITTTNAAASTFKEAHEMNISMEQADVMIRDALSRHFSPEFLGRCDELVPFSTLDASSFEMIANKAVSRLRRRIRKLHGFDLTVDALVYEYLLYENFDALKNPAAGGGRAMNRRVNREITPLIARVIDSVASRSDDDKIDTMVLSVYGELVRGQKDRIRGDAVLEVSFVTRHGLQGYVRSDMLRDRGVDVVAYVQDE